MLQRHKAQPAKKRVSNKLIAGLAAFLTTGVITASGFAGAAPMNKPSKDDCRNAGFSNYGQCVKEWADSKPKPAAGHGHGYGGGNTSVGTNINLQINNSNNNVIQVIVNIFR